MWQRHITGHLPVNAQRWMLRHITAVTRWHNTTVVLLILHLPWVHSIRMVFSYGNGIQPIKCWVHVGVDFIMVATKNTWKVSTLRSLLVFTAYKTAVSIWPLLAANFCRNKNQSTKRNIFSQLEQSSFTVTYCCETGGRALMVQYVLLTLPCQNKQRVSSNGGGSCIPTGR